MEEIGGDFMPLYDIAFSWGKAPKIYIEVTYRDCSYLSHQSATLTCWIQAQGRIIVKGVEKQGLNSIKGWEQLENLGTVTWTEIRQKGNLCRRDIYQNVAFLMLFNFILVKVL